MTVRSQLIEHNAHSKHCPSFSAQSRAGENRCVLAVPFPFPFSSPPHFRFYVKYSMGTPALRRKEGPMACLSRQLICALLPCSFLCLNPRPDSESSKARAAAPMRVYARTRANIAVPRRGIDCYTATLWCKTIVFLPSPPLMASLPLSLHPVPLAHFDTGYRPET